MKVLFPFVGDAVGGSHVATCLLIKKLQQNPDYHPCVLLHQRGGLESYLKRNKIAYDIIDNGSVVCEGNFFRQLYDMVRNIKPLGRVLRDNAIDVVHTNDLRMHYTWLFASFFYKGMRHVWHQHSRSGSWRLAVFSFFTNRVLTISKYCNASFPYFFQRKARIVYNPFEMPKSETPLLPVLRRELNIPDGDKVIGFVGNLTSQKRPGFFIDVAEEFCGEREGFDKYHFVLIGEKREPLYSALYNRIQASHMCGHVHFLGSCFPIESYIQDMDVLVAPAVNEGLGRVVVEAMLCGVPVVAADDGGHKEIVDHGVTGFLMKPSSSTDFVYALTDVLDNQKSRNRVVENGFVKAQKKFSIDAYVQKITDNYDALYQ